ncbi:MAG: transporter substrate-binding domain-containing protein [Burkholderiales bacterium]|nr:transporter substrate-binding domain-containing protein [Burkholderiales bacterium]
MLRSLLALLAIFLVCHVHANERVILPNITPYAFENGGVAKGVEVDVVAAIARHMGKPITVQVMPLARVLATIDSEPGTITFFGRTPEREARVVWLASVCDEPFQFITRRRSGLNIDGVESAKRVVVGVTRSSIGDSLAKVNHLPRVDRVEDDVVNARKLMADRIDTWLGGQYSSRSIAHQLGIADDELHYGYVLKTYQIWMVGSRDLDAGTQKAWQSAFEAIRQSGELARILQNYGMTR